MAFHKGYIIAEYTFIPTSYDFRFLINKFFHLLLWEMQFINFNHSLTINWRGTLKYEIYHNKNLHLLLPSKKYNFPFTLEYILVTFLSPHNPLFMGDCCWVQFMPHWFRTKYLPKLLYSCYFSCLKRWMYFTF